MRKLGWLPTPRWTLAAVLLALLIALLAVVLGGGDDYETAPEVIASLGTTIASIVLGVWMVGVEYGQKTLRRALTAEPRRGRLVADKLVVALGAVAALTIVVWGLAVALFSAAASVNDAASPAGELVEVGAGVLIANLVYAVVGFALTLLTRSMAGGMTLALAFAFVIDTALGAIPEIGDYALGLSVNAIVESIRGEDTDREIPGAIAVTAGWVFVLTAAGLGRFTRADVA